MIIAGINSNRHLKILKFALLLRMFFNVSAWAQWAVGQNIPQLNISDQHDKSWSINTETKIILFAPNRKASNLAQKVLSAQPKDFLASRQAVYLADMSKMPGFITKTIALPSLRNEPFSVGVVLDKQLISAWPTSSEELIVIHAKQGVVEKITYVKTTAELKQLMGLT